MGHNEFWLQFNNGKKEQLNNTKHGVRKEQVDKKFQNLFDAYDANSDGTLEDTELQQIFGHLKNCPAIMFLMLVKIKELLVYLLSK